MNKKLNKFDLLCEDILQEKRSSFLAKAFTNQRYIEEDFDQVWEGSGYKKLLAALDNSLGKNSESTVHDINLPSLDVYKMLDTNSKTYTDLPAGTAGSQNGSAGIKLTYNIINTYKYPLLKILANRNERSDESFSKFGLFNDYINELIANAETEKQNKIFKHINDIKIDMKLEIIATPDGSNDSKTKKDYTSNKKHTHLMENSFSCTIFLWIDAEAYKQEMKNILHNNNTNNTAIDTTDIKNPAEIETIAQQEKNIDAINENNSKIKLGEETIRLLDRDSSLLKKTFDAFSTGNSFINIMRGVGNSGIVNKVLGLHDKDDSSEKPDKIKINEHFYNSLFNLGDITNPYINVLSKVTLETWLYNDNYTKTITDIDKKASTNVAIQMRKPFDQTLLKVDKKAPGELTGDLSNINMWLPGNCVGSTIWGSNNTNIEDYLNLDIDNNSLDKYITCRWQYYLDKSHSMYSEYRVAIELTIFYNYINSLNNLLTELVNIKTELESDNCNETNLIKAINLLQHKPIYIIRNNIHDPEVPENTDIDYLFSQNILNAINNSSLITFLKAIDNNSHHKKYIALQNIINRNIFVCERLHSRNDKPIELDIKNFFNSWWNECYIRYGKSRNIDKYNLISQKHLFTNIGKPTAENIPNSQKHGLDAFMDFDNSSANYFQAKIFKENPDLTINGQLLNDFYNQTDTFTKIQQTISDIKPFFEAIETFNKLMYNFMSDPNPNISRIAKNYLINKL